MNFLGYTHWFMSIKKFQMRDHSISVYQAIYDTYIVAKYLDNVTFKRSTKVYKNIFSSDMIFTKDDASTSDDQLEKLTK